VRRDSIGEVAVTRNLFAVILEQKKQFQDLRQAIGNMTREHRGKLLEVLTDEQKAKLE